MKLFLLYLFLQAFLTQHTDACSCWPAHPQEDYCDVNFAIIGVVEEVEEGLQVPEGSPTTFPPWIPKPIFHTIRVVKDLKGLPESDQETIVIETSNQGSLCGAGYLTQGAAYLLTGSKHHGKYYMNLCHTYSQTKYITESLLDKWLTGFDCDDCQVSRYDEESDDVCNINFINEHRDEVCVRNDDGICEWTD